MDPKQTPLQPGTGEGLLRVTALQGNKRCLFPTDRTSASSHSIPVLGMLPPSAWHAASTYFYFLGEGSRLEKACDHTVSVYLYLLA